MKIIVISSKKSDWKILEPLAEKNWTKENGKSCPYDQPNIIYMHPQKYIPFPITLDNIDKNELILNSFFFIAEETVVGTEKVRKDFIDKLLKKLSTDKIFIIVHDKAVIDKEQEERKTLFYKVKNVLSENDLLDKGICMRAFYHENHDAIWPSLEKFINQVVEKNDKLSGDSTTVSNQDIREVYPSFNELLRLLVCYDSRRFNLLLPLVARDLVIQAEQIQKEINEDLKKRIEGKIDEITKSSKLNDLKRFIDPSVSNEELDEEFKQLTDNALSQNPEEYHATLQSFAKKL